MDNCHEVLNFNKLFLKFNWFICNYHHIFKCFGWHMYVHTETH